MNFKNPEKIVRAATIGIIVYLVGFGIAMAFFPIRPFWNDEWRLLYNIKFKNVHQLWGPLELVQECPRTYLTALKEITAAFDYSYISIRLPALIITIASIFFCFSLRKKIFPNSPVFSYLFILILVSSQTFTDYIVQVKQYEMDIFLCLLTLWQLLTLLHISEHGVTGKSKYLLLCATFLVVPFFSYIYPITVAPLFPIIVFNSFARSTNKQVNGNKKSNWAAVYLPLVLVTISIIIFYVIDVKQLMADDSMYQSYWEMLGNTQHKNPFLENFWNLFSLVGSGFLYEIIFGILGIASFFYVIYRLIQTKKYSYSKDDYLKLYGVFLLLLTLGLFLCNKLLGGVARLTAFTVPSIAILIVFFLEDLRNKYGYIKVTGVCFTIVFLGLFGNIISSCIGRFTYVEYQDRIKTYWRTSAALKQARLSKFPILVTNGAFGDPLKEHKPAPGDGLTAAVVLKDNPEYKVWDTVSIYQVHDVASAREYMKQLPPQVKSAIVGDGINFTRMDR